MVKDRWNEMNERSAYKDWEYKYVQEHEFMTLYNQERVLEDLDRFSEIAHLIRDLHRNILDVEVNIFAEGFSKAGAKLRENANLCYRIFSAVKALQTELDKPDPRRAPQEAEDDMVSRVRSAQFESVKAAYIKAYWKYDGVVRRYEDKIRRSNIVVSSEALNEYVDLAGPSDALLLRAQHRRLSLRRSSSSVSAKSVSLESAQNTLNSLEARHLELLTLERSLVEMRNLFVLFSTLVMEHGSILNLVEGNVQLASGHVARAAKQLETAREYQWKATARKCLCFSQVGFMMAVLVVLVVIACVLLVKKLIF